MDDKQSSESESSSDTDEPDADIESDTSLHMEDVDWSDIYVEAHLYIWDNEKLDLFSCIIVHFSCYLPLEAWLSRLDYRLIRCDSLLADNTRGGNNVVC